jgi:prepilin-type N-terminal cleavage/methylation domain-containing protein
MSSAAGFTLLELLVSMTIVSLLATTVLFGWRIASSAWQKANTHLERSRMVLAANQLLQDQMSSMLPYRARTADGVPMPFFQGDAKSAQFITRYSIHGRASSGLYRVEYQIVEENDSSKLLLNEAPVRSREELGSLISGVEEVPGGMILKLAAFERGGETVTLLDGVKECRFEYYDPVAPSAGGGWKETWIKTSLELPHGMAIRLVNKAPSSDVEPASIVATIPDYTARRP